jgi:putative FmdB family regulatory protein
MPIYDYSCDHCGSITTKLRPVAEHQAPADCAQCGHSAHRIVSMPRLNLMRADVRKAHQINERSAHEPQVRQKHVCHSGCHHPPKSTEAKPTLQQPRSQKRPWMLGH